MIVDICKTIKKDATGNAIVNQIVRSGISPALNYGEAIGAESTKDFIHKMQIVHKELRETWVALLIIKKAKLNNNESVVDECIDECNQLISIFVKSISTNKKKI